MESLFELSPKFPPGFEYTEEFLPVEGERSLLDVIRTLKLHSFRFQGFEAKRKVASFGFDYSFENKVLTKGEPIPDVFDPLMALVAKKIDINVGEFAELLVTEYPPGSVINWHRDAFPFGIIAGISIGSDCIFKLRPHDKAKQSRKTTISFPVKRRSLYVIRDEARYQWQHSIAPVAATRYSITLRTIAQQN